MHLQKIPRHCSGNAKVVDAFVLLKYCLPVHELKWKFWSLLNAAQRRQQPSQMPIGKICTRSSTLLSENIWIFFRFQFVQRVTFACSDDMRTRCAFKWLDKRLDTFIALTFDFWKEDRWKPPRAKCVSFQDAGNEKMFLISNDFCFLHLYLLAKSNYICRYPLAK